MLWKIIEKEMLEQLLSLRLILTFLLVIVLMGADGLIFQRNYQNQLEDYSRNVNRNLELLAQRAAAEPAALYTTFSYGDQIIYRRPNPLGFVAEGHDKDLPNAFALNAFRLREPQYTLRGNPLLWRFDSLDWVLVVGVVLSFAAIVLVYDSVNGEKQQGTLRLIMSQPVSRSTILLAKYLSAVAVLGIPLAAGALLNLVILAIGGIVPIDAAILGRIATGFFFCVIYLSVFALIGIFLSARSRAPVVSLVTGLLVWVSLVIVMPAAGNLAARGLVEIAPQDRVLENANRAWNEEAESYNREHPHPDNWILSGKWSPSESLQRAFEVDEAAGRIEQAHEDAKVSQIELGKGIAAWSPAGLLSRALEWTVSSGISHYEDFLQSARRYRQTLAAYLNGKYPVDRVYPLKPEDVDKAVQVKLDFDSIPKYEDRPAPMTGSAAPLIRSAAILLLINAVLFAAAFVSFLRYDVR